MDGMTSMTSTPVYDVCARARVTGEMEELVMVVMDEQPHTRKRQIDADGGT